MNAPTAYTVWRVQCIATVSGTLLHCTTYESIDEKTSRRGAGGARGSVAWHKASDDEEWEKRTKLTIWLPNGLYYLIWFRDVVDCSCSDVGEWCIAIAMKINILSSLSWILREALVVYVLPRGIWCCRRVCKRRVGMKLRDFRWWFQWGSVVIHWQDVI